MSLENILLMSCRSPYLDSDKIYPPLGLLYLKSSAEQQLPGVNIDLCDDYDLDNPEIFKPYDAIGISIMTPQRAEAFKILQTVKKQFPNKTVIAGGPHVLYYSEEVQKEPFDYLVAGDGERLFPKILQGKGRRIEWDLMPKIEFEKMPRPDRTSDKAKKLLKGYNYRLNGLDSTTAFFARGCTEQCTFCEDAMTGVRWSPMQNIQGELEDIVRLGYKGLYIFDDIFAIALPKTREVAQEIAKRGLIYRCNAQARYFTKWGEDFAKLLASTGCYEIAFGAESGSQKILDSIKKRTTVHQNYQTVEYAKKHGLIVKAFLMLGLPGETMETMKETERFIANSGISDFQLAIYYPYKGTQIRDAIDRGDDQTDLHFLGEGLGAYGQKGGYSEAVVRTSELTREDLLNFRDYLLRKYKPQSHKTRWEDSFFDTHLKKDI